MPAFRGVLSTYEMLTVLAFIKSRWPISVRIYQAMLNPDHAGLPPHLDANLDGTVNTVDFTALAASLAHIGARPYVATEVFTLGPA